MRVFYDRRFYSRTMVNEDNLMKSEIMAVVLCSFLGSVLLLGQTQPKGPEKAVVAPNIPGVVAAGTKVERIWTTTTTSADGLIASADGTLLLPQQATNTISKVDKDGRVTVFLQ